MHGVREVPKNGYFHEGEFQCCTRTICLYRNEPYAYMYTVECGHVVSGRNRLGYENRITIYGTGFNLFRLQLTIHVQPVWTPTGTHELNITDHVMYEIWAIFLPCDLFGPYRLKMKLLIY